MDSKLVVLFLVFPILGCSFSYLHIEQHETAVSLAAMVVYAAVFGVWVASFMLLVIAVRTMFMSYYAVKERGLALMVGETDRANRVVVAKADEQVVVLSDARSKHALTDTRHLHIEPGLDEISARAWGFWHAMHARRKVAKNALPGADVEKSISDRMPDAWRGRIDAEEALPSPMPGRLLLGVDADGEKVVGDIDGLFHIGVGGSTSGGKTTLVRFLLWQLVRLWSAGHRDIEYCAIDVSSRTFGDYKGAGGFWAEPVLTLDGVPVLLESLEEEMHRRDRLFQEVGADNPMEYRLATGEKMPQLLVFVEEATTLMLRDKRTYAAMTKLILEARRTGIYFVISGQRWTSEAIPTVIAENVLTAFQFRANKLSQVKALGFGKDALAIKKRGIAALRTPDGDMTTVKIPFVSKDAVASAVSDTIREGTPGMRHAAKSKRDRIVELYDGGMCDEKQLAKVVYSGSGGKQQTLVLNHLRAAGRI